MSRCSGSPSQVRSQSRGTQSVCPRVISMRSLLAPKDTIEIHTLKMYRSPHVETQRVKGSTLAILPTLTRSGDGSPMILPLTKLVDDSRTYIPCIEDVGINCCLTSGSSSTGLLRNFSLSWRDTFINHLLMMAMLHSSLFSSLFVPGWTPVIQLLTMVLVLSAGGSSFNISRYRNTASSVVLQLG